MRQGTFIKLHEEKWKDFEVSLKNSQALPADRLSYIYVHLTEDLAYAQGRYPEAQVTQYLNELTVNVHARVYSNKPEQQSRFITFWKKEVPLELARAYPYIGYSFLILITGAFIGMLSAANDATFIRLILGDGYVNTTIQNIQNGDPMGIYKSMPGIDMFVFITFNNIRVALLAFAMGIFFSIGTGYVLFQNGVMLGVFHYLFFKYNMLQEALFTIWIHGTLEISAIIIAGAAGLIMGNGLLFPGTYPRLHAFKLSAKRGLKIVLSLIPFFLVAGFLESFITRQTEWSVYIKFFIILVSLSLTIFYLLILPKTNNHDPGKNYAL